MPITQDRMISVIAAGSDYLQAYEKIRLAVLKARQAWMLEKPLAQVFDELESAVAYAVDDPGRSQATLEYEALYYKRHKAGNTRRAAKARINRGDKFGVPPARPSAYETISQVNPKSLVKMVKPPSGNQFGMSDQVWEGLRQMTLDDAAKQEAAEQARLAGLTQAAASAPLSTADSDKPIPLMPSRSAYTPPAPGQEPKGQGYLTQETWDDTLKQLEEEQDEGQLGLDDPEEQL